MRCPLAPIALALALLPGCGGSGHYVWVTGKLLKGETPYAAPAGQSVTLAFVGIETMDASGKMVKYTDQYQADLDPSGSFKLRGPEGQGIPPGKYRVAISQRMVAGGRRLTRQRVIVAEALAAARRALSAQELYERIRLDHPTVGRATVYRALEAQVQDGMASRFERDGHVSAFVACNATHHHHLVCTQCQCIEDLDEAVVSPLLASVGQRHGFQVDHAALDFYGLCNTCARNGARRDRS